MRVLITGATGFVGSHLTEKLVNEGYEVRALARQSSDTSLLKNLNVEIVYGDITNVAAVEKAVTGCQQVYHLAAKTSQARLPKNQFYAINVKGAENVACSAMKANVERLVYVSTGGIYGTIKNPPVDEDTKPSPNSLYRESKLLGEQVVLAHRKKEGLPVVISRISNVFGPGSTNWLGLFQAIAAKRFRIIGAGENHTHMGYITDVVDGLRRCGEIRGIEGEAYLIAGKEPIKLKQLVEIIAQELGINNSRGRRPAGPFRAFSYLAQLVYRCFSVELPHSHRYELFLADNVFDISKAQNELGYCPKVSLREGIQQTIRWYRENGYI